MGDVIAVFTDSISSQLILFSPVRIQGETIVKTTVEAIPISHSH